MQQHLQPVRIVLDGYAGLRGLTKARSASQMSRRLNLLNVGFVIGLGQPPPTSCRYRLLQITLRSLPTFSDHLFYHDLLGFLDCGEEPGDSRKRRTRGI